MDFFFQISPFLTEKLTLFLNDLIGDLGQLINNDIMNQLENIESPDTKVEEFQSKLKWVEIILFALKVSDFKIHICDYQRS